MKILHVLDHSIPLHSGYTFRTRSILREQRKKGWETCHITGYKHNQAVGKALDSVETVDGLRFYRTPAYLEALGKLPVINQMLIVKGLEKRLREVALLEKPDIIHAHSPALNGLAAVNVGKQLGIPVVYEIRAFWEDAAVDHGTAKEGDLRYSLTRQLETKVIKRADAVTTICEGLRNDITARGVPEGKITVIPNAVDIEKFDVIKEPKASLIQTLGLEDAFVIGFIGSFYAYEGLGLILDAAECLKSQVPNLKVLLVGGGPEEQRLKALVETKQLQNQVIFTGRVPHDVVNDYYSVIDVLAYPRLSMRLTELVTPLKPLEAMAQERLFVASDVGGHKELVEDSVNGILFEAGNPQSLADKISLLAQDEALRAALKKNGRQFVESIRNWSNSVARYEAVYTHLTSIARFKHKQVR